MLDQLGFLSSLSFTGANARETPVTGSPNLRTQESVEKRGYKMSSMARKWFLLPMFGWYLLWQLCPFIPLHMRPSIHVDKLLAYERLLFSTLPHQHMSYFHSDILDVVMAVPYTIHVALPIIFITTAYKYNRHLVLPFANCFGLLSFMTVLTEVVFPCAPPWYYEKYGITPASYDLAGDPGGLSRVDKLFTITFYDGMFSKSPLVFGAFPSLHVGWPVLLALFFWHNICRKWYHRVPPVFYAFWVCCSVVYLHHHYVVDILGGALYAWLAYQLLGPHWDDAPLPAQKQPLHHNTTPSPHATKKPSRKSAGAARR